MHIEFLMEGLRAHALVRLGSDCEVLEEYPDRPQGKSKLLLGCAAENDPMPVVVNVLAIKFRPLEPVRIVTVYRSEPPRWRDDARYECDND